jgi:hypothetical protein
MPRVTGAAGTSSYQVEYFALPEESQSASLPICSSPEEVSENPPSPTQ